jgi:hypothetical protein
MNHFTTSDGQLISKPQIDRNIRKAKVKVLELQLEKFGYNFCSHCRRNDCLPLDCAHIESVDSCQKNGYCEKAWDIDNIVILGRGCHQEHDGLNLKFTSYGKRF